MKSRHRPSGIRLALVAALVAGAAGVTYASGAIFGGSPNDPLVVCIDKKGNVQAVDDASQCDKKSGPVKLQRFAEPQSLTVDCAAGQSVGQALADGVRDATLTITVKGTCREAIVIARDDVVLQGLAVGDGLESPAANQSALVVTGRRVRLSQLKLTGGTFGLLATAGSRFSADALHVTGAAANGISLVGNSSGNISNTTIERSDTGLSVAAGSSGTFTGGTIRDNRGGVAARQGGHVLLIGTLINGNSGHGVIAYPGAVAELQGVVVRDSGSFGAYAFGGRIVALGGGTLIEGSRFSGLHADESGSVSLEAGARSARNGAGVSANNGGAVLIQDGGIVENNTGSGVQLANSSSLRMRGGAIIRGNGRDGISLADVTTASFGPSANTIDGNAGWGIFCAGPPAVAQVAGLESVNVSGNTAGQVRCPTAGPPSATVDCAAGQTVGSALANAPASGRFTITIKGTCTESVQVARNDVTLRAFASGDGLAAPSAGPPSVLGFNGARGGQIEGLVLSGGQQGLVANSGAQVNASDLRITGANAGISVNGNAVVNVSGSTIEDTQNGINVGSGGVLTFASGTVNRSSFTGVSAQPGGDVQIVGGSVITNSGQHGIVAQHGGSVFINSSTVSNNAVLGVFAFGGDVFVSGSTLVGNEFAGLDASDGGRAQLTFGSRVAENNGAGVSAGTGGALVIQNGVIIERNTQQGIGLTGASALRMRGGVIVRSNAGHGISLSDTSVASLGESEIVNNGGFGIHCDGPPSVAVIRGDPGNVSGNAAGENNCQSAGG